MKRVLVGRAHVALVDDEDYERVAGYRWHATAWPQSRTTYAYRCVKRNGRRTTEYMHILITGITGVDHVNGNGLDNQRQNLRAATSSQNKQNRPKQRGAYSSRFKGVSWSKRSRKWEAYIKRNGKMRHLGLFDREEDAAAAYDQAARELFGEFAQFNVQGEST